MFSRSEFKLLLFLPRGPWVQWFIQVRVLTGVEEVSYSISFCRWICGFSWRFRFWFDSWRWEDVVEVGYRDTVWFLKLEVRSPLFSLIDVTSCWVNPVFYRWTFLPLKARSGRLFLKITELFVFDLFLFLWFESLSGYFPFKNRKLLLHSFFKIVRIDGWRVSYVVNLSGPTDVILSLLGLLSLNHSWNLCFCEGLRFFFLLRSTLVFPFPLVISIDRPREEERPAGLVEVNVLIGILKGKRHLLGDSFFFGKLIGIHVQFRSGLLNLEYRTWTFWRICGFGVLEFSGILVVILESLEDRG